MITITQDIETLADDLTNKVCEVEEVIMRKVPAEVVIGKVTEVWKHPEADKLMVTKIDCGKHGVFQICTGGENVQAHTYVPVAIPGCYLPALDLKIEPRKMRGLDSNGMICSKKEVGIEEDEEHHRIWTLQYCDSFAEAEKKSPGDMSDITDADCGMALKDKYPWMENRVLDVDNKTLTHRPDLFGHFGLANEIATLYGEQMPKDAYANLMHIRTFLQKQEKTVYERASRGIRLESEWVNVYHIVEIKNITLNASDLQRRVQMLDLGVGPRMNWIDLSNLFMYQFGQPIHCFDAAKVSGDIIVRNAKEWERFVDLFGKEHILLTTDLVIADADKILALAGIVWGENSGISETTQDVLVEIAHFDPVQLRRTGVRLGLRTEAELRYEKHLNPAFTAGMVHVFLDYVKQAERLGAHTVAGVTTALRDEASLKKLYEKRVEISPAKISLLMYGDERMLDASKAKATLAGLGCEVKEIWAEHDNVWEIHVPVRRSPAEFQHGEEIVEEVARIQWYDTIPSRAYTVEPLYMPYEKEIALQRRIEQYLSSVWRADQVETYPWHEQKYIDILWLSTQELFELENPTAPEARYMRETMIWHLVDMIRRNVGAYETCRVFDLGKTWHTKRSQREHKVVSFALWIKTPENDKKNAWESDLRLEGRGLVAGILEQIFWTSLYTITPSTDTYFHPHQQGAISIWAQEIGRLATIHPYVLDELKMPAESKLVVAELDLTLIMALLTARDEMSTATESAEVTYETLQDQIVWKDVSFVLPMEMWYGEVEHAARSVPEISDVELIDLYVGDRLGVGKKSITLRLKLRGDGTMTPEQMNTILAAVIAAVEERGGELRK